MYHSCQLYITTVGGRYISSLHISTLSAYPLCWTQHVKPICSSIVRVVQLVFIPKARSFSVMSGGWGQQLFFGKHHFVPPMLLWLQVFSKYPCIGSINIICCSKLQHCALLGGFLIWERLQISELVPKCQVVLFAQLISFLTTEKRKPSPATKHG